MAPTDLNPEDLPPPRQVTPTTKVSGHRVLVDERDGLARCSCGERQDPESSTDAEEWRIDHLAHAWPEFVPRSPDESIAEWMARIVAELQAAEHLEEGLGGPMVAISADGHDLGVSIETLLVAARIAGLRRQLVQAMMSLD